MTPRARTLVEMQFAASLDSCPHCASPSPARLELIGSGDWWTLAGPCPTCQRPRTWTWHTYGDPLRGAYDVRHLGDMRPSEIIRPAQFVAELDRVLPTIATEPRRLAPADWYASRDALNRALTCLIELTKFLPPNASAIPNELLTDDEQHDRSARPERYAREWLFAERQHWLAVLRAYDADAERIDALERAAAPASAPRGTLDLPALRAHDAWMRSGRRGPGRLDVVGYDAPGAKLVGYDMTGARLEDVTLGAATAEGAELTDAELIAVRADGAHMTSIRLAGAKLVRSTLVRATLPLAVFERATVEACDLRHALLDRSTWTNARVMATAFDEATFGNAILDGATFSGCTLVRADLRPLSPRFPATTRAVFEDCDLRSSRWDGRDVTGATFVRCKLAGIQGRPIGLDAATFVETDLSPDGDGSDIAPAADVRALWR